MQVTIADDCLQPTPMILTLSVHPDRRFDLITEDRLTMHPFVPITEYVDGFGNICHVIRAPQGRLTLSSEFLINDSGEPDVVAPLPATVARTLPVDTLSTCSAAAIARPTGYRTAWSKFGSAPGWGRVQAICDSSTGTSVRLRARPVNRTAYEA